MLGQHGVMELHAVFADPTGTQLAVIESDLPLGRPEPLFAAAAWKRTATEAQLSRGDGGGPEPDDAFTDTSTYFNLSGFADDATVLRECELVCAAKVGGVIGRPV